MFYHCAPLKSDCYNLFRPFVARNPSLSRLAVTAVADSSSANVSFRSKGFRGAKPNSGSLLKCTLPFLQARSHVVQPYPKYSYSLSTPSCSLSCYRLFTPTSFQRKLPSWPAQVRPPSPLQPTSPLTSSYCTGVGFHPHLPGLGHRFMGKALGATMWFWIFYRAK